MIKNLLSLLLILYISATITNAQYEQYYDQVPNINSCNAGSVKQSEKDKVLNLLNKIRHLHELPLFEYDNQFDDEAQEVSLIIVANYADHGFSQENHTPPQDWHCWSQTGRNGGESSNLFFSTGTRESEYSVISWLNDRGVNSLGHRRWILDPFVKKIAFGRVDGIPINGNQSICGMAFYYDSKNEADLSSWGKDFVAFPYGDYPPSYFDDGWSVLSFTAIADKSSRWANNNKVVYSSTLNGQQVNKVYVEIEDESGNITTYTPDNPGQIGWDYGGYGVPNCLIWQVHGLQPQKVYKVRVFDVKVNGEIRNYSYQFALRDPFITKPGATTLASPPNNATDINPNINFQWQGTQGADFYILQISETNAFETNDIIFEKNDIKDNSYQISGVLDPIKTYYWRVAARNNAGTGPWSEIWKFTTTTAPDPPEITGPADNSTNISITPTFTWNAAPKADKYHLQVSDADNFENLLIDKDDITTTSYKVEPDILSPSTEYFWRLRSISNISGPSKWSEIRSFTTAAEAPAAPELLSPPQGAKNQSATLVLKWSDVPGAETYRVQIAKSPQYPEFDIVLDSNNIPNTQIKVPAGILELETQYFWRVQANGPGGTSDWSKNGRFTVGDATAINDFSPKNILQVYPNPANDIVTLDLLINHNEYITLKIYNNLGEVIDVVINAELINGQYIINYDCSNLSNGVYYYSLNGTQSQLNGTFNVIK